MEPSEFNQRLSSLISEARRRGLSPRHVKNALQAKNRAISNDEWATDFERRKGVGAGGFFPLEDEL